VRPPRTLPEHERWGRELLHGHPRSRLFPARALADRPARARTASMSAARIRDDLPEFVRGAELLMERRWSFEDALADHFPRLLKAYGGDGSRIFTLDGTHQAYV
jgi:hypothetical protein